MSFETAKDLIYKMATVGKARDDCSFCSATKQQQRMKQQSGKCYCNLAKVADALLKDICAEMKLKLELSQVAVSSKLGL
jgi:hypothetical protein